MKNRQPAKRRVLKFLQKQTRRRAMGWDYSDAKEPRQQAKVLHPLSSVLWALELGLTSNQATLRDVEEMTDSLGPWARGLIPNSISDTTLDTELQRLDAEYLLGKLVLRIRGFHRSKMLTPVALPCGVVTVDGKNLATVDHDANGTGHRRSKDNEKWHRSKADEQKKGTAYYLMPALRATLSSAEMKPCVYQLPLPPGVGEATVFPQMLTALQGAYGRSGMFKIVDADAGLTSLANANLVVENDCMYVFGLKGNQPELFAEANALLLKSAELMPPEVETPWEVRSGKRIRRRLWRTDEMAEIENSVGRWDHLKQTWLIRQETRGRGGKIDVEDRFFITSVPWDYLRPGQILGLVRSHWAVENDCFNSLDLQWREDSGPWCTRGSAIWALGVLRLLAYNTAQLFRRRHLRPKAQTGRRAPPLPWRSLFKIIDKSLELDAEPDGLCTG